MRTISELDLTPRSELESKLIKQQTVRRDRLETIAHSLGRGDIEVVDEARNQNKLADNDSRKRFFNGYFISIL